MKPALTPLAVLAAATCALLVTAAALVWLARSQPWVGMQLAVQASGQGLVIQHLAPDGPAARAGLRVGDRVLAIGDLPLRALDIVEEPDTLRSYDDARALYARQDRLFAALRAETLPVDVGTPTGQRRVDLRPEPHRPLWALPMAFWLQGVVGAGGVLIGVWVWCLRRRDIAARLTAVAGGALAIMVFPAALYSTRELALPDPLFRTLAAIDHYGAFAVGVALVTIFYVYPRRIVPWRALYVLPIGIGLWWLADTSRVVFSGPPTGFHLPILLMLLMFVPAAVMQHRLSRHDPVTRAALRWFTLAVVVGTGTFTALVIVPNLFGLRQMTSQSNAFLLLLIVFAGIGLSVARYRLFELENWAFGLLYNFATVVAIFGLDMLLVSVLAFNRTEALSIALILGLLAYLPLRERIRRRLASSQVQRGALFQRVVDVALTPPHLDQNERWAALLRHAYDPLHLQIGGAVEAPRVYEEGLGLALPAVAGVAAVRLTHARGGRQVFSRADEDLARELCAMLGHAIASRSSREAGVAEERARIARDMHDNIGATLLSALHYPGAERKDAMIRDALSDFRAILNDSGSGARRMDHTLADLRVECADRLEAAGVALDWTADEAAETILSAQAVHTLRSILREAVSNVLRHAGAHHVEVRIGHDRGRIALSVKDDGRGFAAWPATPAGHGHGLTNICTRLEALGGGLRLDGGADGVELTAAFALG